MAVEAKNKRKRKHQNVQEDGEDLPDDGEVAVPKKIAKKVKQPKEDKKLHKTQKGKSPVVGDIDEDEGQADYGQCNAGDASHAAAVEEEEGEYGEMESAKQMDRMKEHDSGYEEKTLKFSKDFKMLNFRTKLRSNNFITGKI